MDDLLDEMRQCKSVKACIDLALTDAYGEDEQAVAWLTCIEEMFGRFKQVRVMGNDVTLLGFDLRNCDVVAICQQGKRNARVTLDSIEFPDYDDRTTLAAGVEAILCDQRLTYISTVRQYAVTGRLPKKRCAA